MGIIKSKYTIIMLSAISTVMCLFPMLSAEITGGEAYTSVIHGYNLLEFSTCGIVSIIAPALVTAILYGCQSKAAKELELIVLAVGNLICYVHSVHNAWMWLFEIGASAFEVKVALFLYPLIFLMLCIMAIIQNCYENKFYEVT